MKQEKSVVGVPGSETITSKDWYTPPCNPVSAFISNISETTISFTKKSGILYTRINQMVLHEKASSYHKVW